MARPYPRLRPTLRSWRIDDDIAPNWDSFLRCLDNAHGLSQFAGPGAWNDLDSEWHCVWSECHCHIMVRAGSGTTCQARLARDLLVS